jgi:hypothetical protein
VLQIKGKEMISSIEIFNALGQQLLTFNCNQSEVSVPTSKLKNGIYVVKIKNQNGLVQQFKIQKN